MRKKFLVNLTAIATAASMMLTPAVTVFAEGDEPASTSTTEESSTSASNESSTSTDEGSSTSNNESAAVETPQEPITETIAANNETVVENRDVVVSDGASAIKAENNSSVTVNGNVTTSGFNKTETDYAGNEHKKGDPAIDANNSAVNVTGNVIGGSDGSESTAIKATNHSTFIVSAPDSDTKAKVAGTDVGIDAYDSTVNVNGNVVGGEFGVGASNSNVTVKGNITATGNNHDFVDSETGQVIGNSYSGNGVYATGSSNITVDGNVVAPSHGNGVEVNIGNKDYHGKSTVYVGGTIVSGLNIHDNGDYENEYNKSGFTKADVLDLLPEITVYELQGGFSTHFYDLSDDENREVRETLLKSINYIIKADSSVSFVDDQAEGAPRTTNLGQSFKIRADLADNQMLSFGDNNNVAYKLNDDGSYTLTLMDTRGGINIRAILKPVPKKEEDSSPAPAYEVVIVEEAQPVVTPSYADPNQAPAGAIVVSNTTEAVVTPEIAAISGDKPARTVSYNLTEITPVQYKESVLQNVAAAPAGGAFNIETDRVSFFDRKMIEAFEARPDIDVNVVFTYGGKKLKITIPAGYNVKTLLDENGYCGFLRLLALLGAEELI